MIVPDCRNGQCLLCHKLQIPCSILGWVTSFHIWSYPALSGEPHQIIVYHTVTCINVNRIQMAARIAFYTSYV